MQSVVRCFGSGAEDSLVPKRKDSAVGLPPR